MTTETVARRDSALDALRGLAVALVVLGHSIYDVAWVYHPGPGLVEIVTGSWVPLATATNPLLTIAYSVHTPLLAFVSGLVLWRPVIRPAVPQLKRRALGLLVPYLAWAAVYYAFDVIRNLQVAPPGEALLAAVTGVSTTGPLWYLYALFICCALLIGIERLPGHRWILGVTAVLAIGMSQIPAARTSTLAINQVIWLYPFFSAGYLIALYRNRVVRYRMLLVALCGLAFAALVYVQFPIPAPELSVAKSIDTALDAYGIPGTFTIVRYLAAFAGCLAAFALYLGLPERVLAPQAWLGRRTLGVFASSTLFGTLLVMAGMRSWAILFVCSLTLSAVATLGLERVPALALVFLGQKRSGAPDTLSTNS